MLLGRPLSRAAEPFSAGCSKIRLAPRVGALSKIFWLGGAPSVFQLAAAARVGS